MGKVIHILAGKANPNTLNGVNKVVHSIAEEQVKSVMDVSVYGVANNTVGRHNHTYPIKLFKKSKIKVLPPLKLIKCISKQEKNVLFHLHSAYITWFPLLVIYLKLKGVKYVLTPHGAYNVNNFKVRSFKFVYFYLVEFLVLLLATKIHILGKSELNKYSNFFIRNKAVLIPNGCTPMNNDMKKVKDTLVFGYLGRLKIDHKGLDLLIKAFAVYVNKGGIGILELVGDGPDKKALLDLAKELNITSFIRFSKSKFEEDKTFFLSEISYFVHTSRWEGFPMSCLEALALNTPLLVSPETNMGEIVSSYSCGVVLNELTIVEITNKLFVLENIFQKTEYDSMIEGCRSVILNKLSWNKVKDSLNKELYNINM